MPERGSAPRLASAAGAVAHATLFALAFPPVGAWPAALAALAPLAWLALRAPKPARAAGIVWIVSAVMWLVMERWLIGVSAAGWPLLAMYLALYPASFVWIGARLARRWPRSRWGVAVALAAVWVGLEFLRGGVVLTGYPWFLIAHPLIDTPVAQLAEWIGVYGVSLVVAFPQTLAASAVARPCVRIALVTRLVAAGAVIGIAWGAGSGMSFIDTISSDGRAARVAVVQTNVPQSNKIAWSIQDRLRDFASMREMTLEAAGAFGIPSPSGGSRATSPDEETTETSQGGDQRTAQRSVPLGEAAPLDLIVWPETMFPGETLSPAAVAEIERAGLVYEDGTPATAFNEAIHDLQRSVGVPMLVGSIGYDGLRIGADGAGVTFEHDGKFNSAFLIEGGAVREERYDKLHLTPFGEVMPGISWSDRLEGWLLSLGAGGMKFDLDAGRTRTVFEAPLSAPRAREGSREIGMTGETPVPPAETEDTADPRTAQRAVPPGALRLVTPICFESATPGVCRRLVFEGGVRRADVIVNLTNDGWFGSAPGKRAQALQVARWRCVELRTPMVRAANTGLSAALDSTGRVQALGPENRSEPERTAGVMLATVRRPTGGVTVYARIGDVAGWVSLLVAGVAAGSTITRGGGPTPR